MNGALGGGSGYSRYRNLQVQLLIQTARMLVFSKNIRMSFSYAKPMKGLVLFQKEVLVSPRKKQYSCPSSTGFL